MTGTTSSRDRIDRRTVLSSLAGVVATIAGCTGTSSDADDPNRTSSQPSTDDEGPIESVEMTGTDLTVELANDAAVDYVTLRQSNGDATHRQPVVDTQTVAFSLLGAIQSGYDPGTYAVVATADGEPVGETTITLEPNVRITDVRWAKNHPEMDWDRSVDSWEQHAALRIENTGNAPSFLTSVEWTGAPLCRIRSQETLEFHHQVLLPAGETTTVYSSAPIYRTSDQLGYGESVDCGELDREPLTVTGHVQAGQDAAYTQTISYGESDQSCELSVVEGSPTTSTQTTAGTETAQTTNSTKSPQTANSAETERTEETTATEQIEETAETEQPAATTGTAQTTERAQPTPNGGER